MRQIQFIRSNTFLWALAVAAAFALFVVGLFAFTYWKLDDYLIARSDRMITTRINFIADLPPERRIGAISDHLEQDSRGVQYAGLFNDAGTRLAGNIDSLPRALDLGGAAQGVRLDLIEKSAVHGPVIRVVGRRLENGDVLVMDGTSMRRTKSRVSWAGARARPAAGVLPLSAGRSVAECSRPETRGRGEPAGAADRGRGVA
ncbi:hypothetical protein ACQ5SK_37415 [Bradyrhizobium japonicum]